MHCDIENVVFFVKSILLVVDLEQGGKAYLSRMGYNLHCTKSVVNVLAQYDNIIFNASSVT